MSGMESNGSSRISVSEDKLDAKLSGLELRLVDRITRALDSKADLAEVKGLRERVHTMQSTLVALSNLPTVVAEIVKKHEETADEVDLLKQAQAGRVALSTWQRFAFGTVGLGVVSVIATLVSLLAQH